jgi:hypothetical protein
MMIIEGETVMTRLLNFTKSAEENELEDRLPGKGGRGT